MKTGKQVCAEKLGAAIGLIIIVVPLICIIDAFGTTFRQLGNWFKTGVWEPRTFWGGVNHWFLTDRPAFEWVIPNHVLNWMLDGPRSFWMLALGCLVAILEIVVLVVGLTYADKAWKHWQGRHERPLITMSKRMKIAVAITAAWMLCFPTVIAGLKMNSDIWGGTFLVAGIISFWGWVGLGLLQNRKDKAGRKA